MQNKLYTIQFFSPPNDQLHSKYPSSDCRTHRFPGAHMFHGFHQTHKFCRTHHTHGKTLNSWKSSNVQKRHDSFPQPTPIHKLSMTSVVWNISIGQLGYMSGCASSKLLHTCTLAECEKLGKLLDFLTSKTISVINILLIPNPKHSSYWEEN